MCSWARKRPRGPACRRAWCGDQCVALAGTHTVGCASWRGFQRCHWPGHPTREQGAMGEVREIHMLMGPEMQTGRVHMGQAPLQSLCCKLSRGVLTVFRACRTMRRLHGRAPQYGVHKGGDKGGAPQVREHCGVTTKLGAGQLHGGTSLPSKFGAGPKSPTWPRMVCPLQGGWCAQRHLDTPTLRGMGGVPREETPAKSRPSRYLGRPLTVFPGWRGVGSVAHHGPKAKDYPKT